MHRLWQHLMYTVSHKKDTPFVIAVTLNIMKIG